MSEFFFSNLSALYNKIRGEVVRGTWRVAVIRGHLTIMTSGTHASLNPRPELYLANLLRTHI